VVEDDPISAHALRILLRRSGWSVEVAGSISEAQAYLQLHNPKAVILDLMLPDGDGSVILQAIRAQNRDIRVTVTTAIGDPARIEQVKAMKPNAFLKKPIELADLMQSLD